MCSKLYVSHMAELFLSMRLFIAYYVVTKVVMLEFEPQPGHNSTQHSVKT